MWGRGWGVISGDGGWGGGVIIELPTTQYIIFKTNNFSKLRFFFYWIREHG